MFALNYLHYLKSICLVLALGCLFTSNSFAQDASNKRGFQPGNSFSIGDFETINTTNGNLMFNFPLGGLPPGRNGLTAGINLYYSSKLLDSETKYFDKANPCGPQSPDCPYYKKLLLKESDQGGWHFGMGYSLRVVDRREQYVTLPIELQPTCSPSDPRYFEMRYHLKLILTMPDGSTHEMRPNGWSDGNFNDPLGDYFEISPDGFWFNCSTSQWYTNTITYYSIDGSFLRLDIQHDGNTAGGWQDNPWTLYFPDGSKVTTNQPNNQPQRVYDPNNNYIEIDGTTIRDQFNRSISIASGTQNGKPVNTITSQGFGETLTWTISWKTISVLKNYWPCEETLNCDPEIPNQEPYGWLRSVVDTITMPAQAGGLTYTFTYNAPDHSSYPLISSNGWGEVNGVTLPSGAHIDYQYAQDGSQPDSATPDVLRNSPTSKVLTYNREYDGTSTPVTETWSYGITTFGSSVTTPDEGTTTTDFFDTSAASWSSGLAYRSVGPDGTKTETIWARNDLATGIASNPYAKTVLTSIKNAAGTYVKTTIKDYKYDKNGNVTRVADYDWINYASVPRDGQGLPTGIPSVSPTRVLVNTYFNSTPDATQVAGSNTNVYWSSGSPRVKKATASSEVRRILGGGTEDPVTRVEYTYDNAAAPANLTQTRTWDSTKGAYTSTLVPGNSLATTTQYNQYGMPTLTTDPRGLKTFTTYGLIGSVTDLYPTQIKRAYQSSEERTETCEYDFGTGLMTRVTDNNNVSTVTSFDALGRPTLVRAGESKSEETRTATEYSDVARRVITRSDLTTVGDGKLVSIQHYDQLGRVRLSRQLEDAAQDATDETTGIKVQTRYRYSGANSFVLVSTPYRAATSNATGSETTMGWTRQKSDNAGRMIEVQTFGGASLPAPWGSSTVSTGTSTTAYDANFMTVTDQAQKSRRTLTDGLGRVIRVDEPDLSGNLGSTTSPAQPTDYSYDVQGNLTHVTQSDGTTTQNRDFNYSSLSLLTASTQPESGTSNFKYDASGNVIVKTDARNVSIHYAYDSLNRVTRRWYNGSNSDSSTTHNSPALPSGVGATDEVKFYYDAQTLPTGAPSYTREYTSGRLVAQTYGTGSNGDYYSYDALGRAKLKYQQTGTVNYRVSATYNRAGAATSLTYPSDHTITNSFDTAGRLLSLSGNIGTGGTSRTYASGILYTPGGALTKEQFGTTTAAVYNKRFYNSRGQLAEIRVGTSYTGPTDYTADRGSLVNAYSSQCTGNCLGFSMTDNNGNLKKQEIYIPGSQMRWQQFDYDSLNRLNWAREVLDGGAEQWKQQFTYDRFGNRTINTGVTYGGINEKEFSVNAANQLGVAPGQSGAMEYDAAGNLINDTYTGKGNRTYDAENRMTSAIGWNDQAQLYVYGASGQRIKRTVNGATTWQVFGLGGELLAEYADSGSVTSPQKEYGYRNGELLITGEPLTAQQSTENVSWTNAVGVSVSGNSLTKTAATNWNNGGASSSQAIVSGDGYVEFTASETTTSRMIGLSNGDTNQDYPDLDFAAYLDSHNLCVYEAGVSRGCFSTFVSGDLIRVAVESGVVKYKKNGSVFFTSTVTPTYPLLVDTAIWSNGGTLNSAVVSGLITGGGGTPPANTQNVSWTNAVGVLVSGNSLTKTAATNWNNGGAASSQAITSGDGYVEFTASETTTSRMIGLSNGDTNQDYTDLDFAAYLTGANLCVYEAGVSRGCLTTYVSGDLIRVAVESGVVKYKKNGSVFYTSSNTPNYPLLVDTAIWDNGGTLNNAVISGNLSGGTPPPSTQNVSWANTVGVSVSGNSLTKTAATNWNNGGASSSQAIVSGDGYMEFTASETTTSRMIGLSNGDTNQDYPDLDFAAYLDSHNLCVYEAGVSRGCFSTFVSGDLIRVAVESGVVKYKKNGTVIYTSGNTPTYPLLVDTAIWSNGGTLNNAVISGNLGGGGGGTGGVHWLVSDQLGTPRMIIDQTGSNVKRHDYLPFGEELVAPYHGRSTPQGYEAGDGVRQQFTSKERDFETGLDYFGARFYSNVQGRFISPDPLIASGAVQSPQSWNRYTYCLNDPLKFIDPTGLIWQTRTTVTNGVSQTEYMWVWKDNPDEGWDRVTDFWVDVVGPDGNTVGLRLNPNGPMGEFRQGFFCSPISQMRPFSNCSDYAVKGFEFTESSEERRRPRGIDMMQNQAFDIGLTFPVGGLARVPLSARFLAAENGRILDVSRIGIPGPTNSTLGKLDYLLGRVAKEESIGKGGFFKDFMGHTDDTLDSALRTHLKDNFSTAQIDGERIRATGSMAGPRASAENVKTVWQVTAEGAIHLITAMPEKKP